MPAVLMMVAFLAVVVAGCAGSRMTYGPDGSEMHSINCSGWARNWGMCLERMVRLVVAALLVLTFTESASAECAWVLWTRASHDRQYVDWASGGSVFPTYSKCWAVIHQFTGVAEEGSLADWLAWLRRHGRYRDTQSGPVRVNVLHGSVIMATDTTSNEWRCLPETMDPRGPKER